LYQACAQVFFAARQLDTLPVNLHKHRA
jgi:hypothetical protein